MSLVARRQRRHTSSQISSRSNMPTFFKSPEKFRVWLEENHEKEKELWVGYFKKATGKPSITWPESVDQALCFGWIDGIRKRIDDEAYMIRFTPRKKDSHWSKVNLDRIKVLKADGLVTEAGLNAFKRRKSNKTANASYEQKKVVLDPVYEQKLQSNKKAWDHFSNTLSPSIRKQCIWWIMSAKRRETQEKRLKTLIQCSAKKELIPPLIWSKRS